MFVPMFAAVHVPNAPLTVMLPPPGASAAAVTDVIWSADEFGFVTFTRPSHVPPGKQAFPAGYVVTALNVGADSVPTFPFTCEPLAVMIHAAMATPPPMRASVVIAVAILRRRVRMDHAAARLMRFMS